MSQTSRVTEDGAGVMPETGYDLLQEILRAGDRAVWTAAALAVALREGGAEDQRRAAVDVLRALGLRPRGRHPNWIVPVWQRRRPRPFCKVRRC